MPGPLVVVARMVHEGGWCGREELLEHAYTLRGIPSHGLLGTIRLLKSDALLSHYGAYALKTARKNLKALLPGSDEPPPRDGYDQAKLDAIGTLASTIAQCSTFTSVLALLEGAALDRPLFFALRELVALEGESMALGRILLLGLKEAVGHTLEMLCHGEQEQQERSIYSSKALGTLEAGVGRLSEHITTERRDLRFEGIRRAARDAGPLVPHRPPEPPKAWAGLPPHTKADAAFLADIQQKLRNSLPIKASDFDAFLKQALSLPQNTNKASVAKAGFLMDLGARYAGFGTPNALQQGIRCDDQALIALFSPGQEARSGRRATTLAKCYEQRGQAFQMLASCSDAQVGRGHDGRLARAKRNAAYRDFAEAHRRQGHGHPNGAATYVAEAQGASHLDSQTAQRILSRISALDGDYSDAHLQLFWRSLEADELDRLPQPDSGRERRKIAPSQILAKTRAAEAAISAWYAAGATALYHQHLASGQTLCSRPDVGQVMEKAAVERVIDLHVLASQLYAHDGGEEQLACAILHLCHGIGETTALGLAVETELGAALQSDDKRCQEALKARLQAIAAKEFRQRMHKGALFARLGLWSCQAAEMQIVLGLTERHAWRRRAARVRLELGMAYQRQGDSEAATRFLSDARRSTRAGCKVRRRSSRLLNTLTAPQEARQASLTRGPGPGSFPALFQDGEIIHECVQVLSDNVRACGSNQGWVWDGFVKALLCAQSIREWVESILGRVRLDDQVTPQRILRLTKLADMQDVFSDPALLGEMKGHIDDALSHVAEQERCRRDSLAAARDLERQRLEQCAAFGAAVATLRATLQKGEVIRPASRSRQHVEELSFALADASHTDAAQIVTCLEAVTGEVDSSVQRFLAENISFARQELGQYVEEALDGHFDTVVEPSSRGLHAADGFSVLSVSGRTLFVSQCWDSIKASIQANGHVGEVRFVAQSLYIDADIVLCGTTVVLGASYVEWIKAQGANGASCPLAIDLRGRGGNAAAKTWSLPKAASGSTFGGSGDPGKSGGEGEPGQPGGDLIILAPDACVGLTPEHVSAIMLDGGQGGPGGDGQGGGDAEPGRPGVSADESQHHQGFWKRFGNGITGYDFHLPGTQGGEPGQAGVPGPAGPGGSGGEPGRFILTGHGANEEVEADAQPLVQANAGQAGQDGQPGQGGLGARPGVDGNDLVLVKRHLFARAQQHRGHGLHYVGGDRRRCESWQETPIPAQDSATRDRQHAHTPTPARARQRIRRRQLDMPGIAAQVDTHLAQKASESERDAFAELTGPRALAEEALAGVTSADAEAEAVLGELNELRASTAALASQTQQHRQAQAEQLALGPSRTSAAAGRPIRVAYDGDEASLELASDSYGPLGLADSPVSHPRGCALVAHPVEIAMERVNTSHGGCPAALGALLRELAAYFEATIPLAKLKQAQVLLGSVADLITALPLEVLIVGMAGLREGWRLLDVAKRGAEPGLGEGIAKVRRAIYKRSDVAELAASLHRQLQRLTAAKVAEGTSDFRVRIALLRELADDRLMHSLLKADLGLSSRRAVSRRTSARLAERLEQKVSRVTGPSQVNAARLARYRQWAEDMVQSLRAQAAHSDVADAHGVTKMSHQWARDAAKQVDRDRIDLAEQEHQVERRLARASASLAKQRGSLPANLDSMDLSGIADFLHGCGAGAVADTAQIPPAPEAGLQAIRPADTLASVREQLSTGISQAPGQRLHLHLERQLESIRPNVGSVSAWSVAQVAATFAEAYAANSNALSDELRPLAGEAAARLAECSHTHTRDLFMGLGGQDACPEEDQVAFILRRVISAERPQELEAHLRQRAGEAPEEEDGLVAFLQASCELLRARLIEMTTGLLAECSPPSTGPGVPGEATTAITRQDATQYWLPQVERWLAFSELIPERQLVDVLHHAAGQASSSSEPASFVGAAVSQAVLQSPTPNPVEASDPEAAMVRLAKELDVGGTKKLTYGARAALFLLATSETSTEVTYRVLDLLRQHLPEEAGGAEAADQASSSATSCVGDELWPLELVEEEFSRRAWDDDVDLAGRWEHALARLQHKIAMVGQHDKLRGQLAVDDIQRMLAVIHEAQTYLAPRARAEILERAIGAAGAVFARLPASLGPIRDELVGRVGQLHCADGWPAELAIAYNAGLPGRHRKEHPQPTAAEQAERFVKLVSLLPAQLPEGAEMSRLERGLAVGLEELDLTLRQQIDVHLSLHWRQEGLPSAVGVLYALQGQWRGQVEAVAREFEQGHAQSQASIAEAQKAFMTKISDLVDSVNISFAADKVADAELFVALLDQHFAASRGDRKGAQRCAAYLHAYEHATASLGGPREPEAAFEQMAAYYRRRLWEQVESSAQGDQIVLLKEILSQLRSNDGRTLDKVSVEGVIARLGPLAWRGVTPYWAEDSECALSLLRAYASRVTPNVGPSAQNDDNFDALARCIRTKFDAHLAHVETYDARETTRKHLEQDHAARAQALANAREWLTSSILSPDEVEAVAGVEAGLKAYLESLDEGGPMMPWSQKDRAASPSASRPAPGAEAMDAWLLRLEELQGRLLPDMVEADVLPVLVEYLKQCEEKLKQPDGESPASLWSSTDDACLAATYAFLQRPWAAAASSSAPHGERNKHKALRGHCRELATKARELQLKRVAQCEAGAKQRQSTVEAAVRHGVASLPASHPIMAHLDAILSRGEGDGDAQAFVRAHLGGQHDRGLSQQLAETLGLKKALDAAAAKLGDQAFVSTAKWLVNYMKERGEILGTANILHIWLAILEVADNLDIEGVLEDTLPENWATALRQLECERAMEGALGALVDATLGAPPPASLTQADIDTHCQDVIESMSKLHGEGTQWWADWLTCVRQTPHLASDQRAQVMGLMARKLAHFGASKTKFPYESFQSFAEEMRDPAVLDLIGCELNKSGSSVIDGLQSASFKEAQKVMTQIWVIAKLKPHMGALVPAEGHRLVALLVDLAAVRQRTLMGKVVQAMIQGGSLTSDEVDAVAGFVDGSLVLDDQAVELVGRRAENHLWLRELSKRTLEQRSRLRLAPDIARLMAGEREGANRSVADWVVREQGGGPSKLETALGAVWQALERPATGNPKPIKSWTRRNVSAWAAHRTTKPQGGYFYSHQGPRLWESPERLYTAVAVLCRGVELVHGYLPRDTQLAAILLIVRDGVAPDRPGKLAQVATGEGKSIITAGVAILKAMGGQLVDVITTSKVLAERDARHHVDLYNLFGMQVTNNCDAACEDGEGDRSAEAVRRERYESRGEPTPVIYGEAGAFERDQLLTTLNPGEPDKHVVGQGRKNVSRRSAVVDEADGLLLDEASMVLYLSQQMQSLTHFSHTFVCIWDLVNSIAPSAASAGDDEVVMAVGKAVREKIEAKQLDLPTYKVAGAPYMEIESVVAQRLNSWIRSALHACRLQLNREYVIVGANNPAVVVVDKGTGVEQASVKWSHGLHQFLQLKHGLDVSAESLKGVFLSNRFFFKQYGNRICGLSGTLGSEAEQSCLASLYDVECLKIPRASGEKYVQKAPEVHRDAKDWLDAIETGVAAQRQRDRAVLIVCDSIADVLMLAGHLKRSVPDLYTYTSAHQELAFLDLKEPRAVRPRDLIIATNLAGRGTDFKTSRELEEAGGLHVILSYLPANLRIQEQAFGRTARGGNRGSGQFIICDPSGQPLHGLCGQRDLAEGQRLEKVVQRDVCRIDCEQDLLTGFFNRGERLGGFLSVLAAVVQQVCARGEPDYYVEAQLESLKNRWRYWLASMDSQLDLVHVTGRNGIAAAYREFEDGVYRALGAGWEGLIVEPDEWMRLAGCYRRAQRWREAERCLDRASSDPAFGLARYYLASCRLVHTPTSDRSEKKAFHDDAKVAGRAVEEKLRVFQESQAIVSRLSAQSRLRGDQGFGDPFVARIGDHLKVWEIFLSSIRKGLGYDITTSALKESPYVKDEPHAQQVLDQLAQKGLCKPLRVSHKFALNGSDFRQGDKEILGLHRFAPIAGELGRVLHPGSPVSKEALSQAAGGLMTTAQVVAALKRKATSSPHLRVEPLPVFWSGWEGQGLSSTTQSALTKHYEQCRQGIAPGTAIQDFERRFMEVSGESGGLSKADCGKFFRRLQASGIVVEDAWLDFTRSLRQSRQAFVDLTSAHTAVTRALTGVDPSLTSALASALVERHAVNPAEAEEPELVVPAFEYRLKKGVYVSELSLFESADEAVGALLGALEGGGSIKGPKLKLPSEGDLKAHAATIKGILRESCGLNFDRTEARTGLGLDAIPRLQVDTREVDTRETDRAVDSVFAILEPTIGMLRALDDTKVTIKFEEIARAFFLDHGEVVPQGMRDFVEAGLDVVASLVEKKDPPAWWEVAVLAVVGMAQVVAGAVIKTCLPVAGELVGNVLINTGLDDVVFGVSSALSGEFSWQGYWSAKQSSMVSAVKSAGVSAAASFAVATASHGVGGACRLNRTSYLRKLRAMEAVRGKSLNVASQVAKEVGRSLANSGIAQVASRGMNVVVGEIAGAYTPSLERRVQAAVGERWAGVEEQARALWSKLRGDTSVQGVINELMEEVLTSARRESRFSSVTRTSKPAIGAVASDVAKGGWATLLPASADVVNLGFAAPRMVTLVKTEVNALGRSIREARERKSAVSSEPDALTDEAAFSSFLSAKEREFGRGLTAIMNSLLESSVYSPLVSLGSQLATDKAVKALLPPSQAEIWASSDERVLEALDREDDASKAYYDDILRKYCGADIDVDLTTLSPEEQSELRGQAVEGTHKTLGHLELDYQGHKLKVYRDDQHRLYVQRPDRSEYSQAIEKGAPAGPPTFMATAIRHKRAVSIKDHETGKVTTYHPDGRVDNSSPKTAIKLLQRSGENGGLGHISAMGAPESRASTSSTTDCFQEAVIQSLRSPAGMTVATERQGTAECLRTNDTCGVFYHAWSLDGNVKEFSGYSNPQKWLAGRADAYDAFADRVWEQSKRKLLADPDQSSLNRLLTIGKLSAVDLGRLPADVLRLGEGVKEGTFLGVGKDMIRLTCVVVPGGYGVKFASRGVTVYRDARWIKRYLNDAWRSPPISRNSRVVHYHKLGDYGQMHRSLSQLARGRSIVPKGNGKEVLAISRGRVVTIRQSSSLKSGTRPTLDINRVRVKGSKKIKVRHHE